MQRIESIDKAFHSGETVVTETWLNSIQEEICNFIEKQGIEIHGSDSKDYTQLECAITKFSADFVKKEELQAAVKDFKNKIDWLTSWIQYIETDKTIVYPTPPPLVKREV